MQYIKICPMNAMHEEFAPSVRELRAASREFGQQRDGCDTLELLDAGFYRGHSTAAKEVDTLYIRIEDQDFLIFLGRLTTFLGRLRHPESVDITERLF